MGSLLHRILTLLSMVVGCLAHLIASVFVHRHTSGPRKLLIFLGSGGHTTELLSIIKCLDLKRKYQATFVVSTGDQISLHKLKNSGYPYVELITIIRARHVGQNYFTSILTTLASLIQSIWICIRLKPDLLLCNGPGTSIPLCVTSKVLGSKCVYIESFCRTQTLSLSAKMAAHIVDHVLVQYPQLIANYPDIPRLKYIGLLV